MGTWSPGRTRDMALLHHRSCVTPGGPACRLIVVSILIQIELNYKRSGRKFMDAQHYYVDKISDTSADTLLAVGFASLLSEVSRKLNKPTKVILIHHTHPYSSLHVPLPLTHYH